MLGGTPVWRLNRVRRFAGVPSPDRRATISMGASEASSSSRARSMRACVLHDLGTSPAAGGTQRFEVDGADLAAEFLTGNGVGARGVDLVWEAIALHSSPGIAERRGALAYLTRRGVGIDFGPGSEFITDAQGEAVHSRYPRLRMVPSLIDEIVRHAGRSPQNAPRYSIAGELVRERGQQGHPTAMERAALTSRWGE